MKIEKNALVERQLVGLIPMFRGLSEKGALAMMDKMEKATSKLANMFFKLQKKDLKNTINYDKKTRKEEQKLVRKAKRKIKIDMILGLEKPVRIVEIPEKAASKNSFNSLSKNSKSKSVKSKQK